MVLLTRIRICTPSIVAGAIHHYTPNQHIVIQRGNEMVRTDSFEEERIKIEIVLNEEDVALAF